MSTKQAGIAITPASPDAPDTVRPWRKRWIGYLWSPLWVCLLLALLLRLWVIAHTQGIIDGDEAQVGVQAMRILQGEHPVYFYGQPYMGSLAAHVIALLFALFGVSVWTLRMEPLLASLLLVWLTWRLAGALANEAHLPETARRVFMTVAALIAALPPLYDGVLEMRVWNGYVETFVLSLLLLLSALRLIQRWRAGAGARELALRWAGIGFVVGLGFWVDPLIVMATLASALWLGGSFLLAWWRQRRGVEEPGEASIGPGKALLLVVAAIPASLVGFAPAIYWGATNQWANILYLLHPGSNLPPNPELALQYPTRFAIFKGVVQLYSTCLGPRVLSGALPGDALLSSRTLHSPGGVAYLLALGVGAVCIVGLVAVVGLSYVRQQPLLVQGRRLAGLPLVFGACAAGVFCFSTIAANGLLLPCAQDKVGQYTTPLVLALPFICATAFTLLSLYLWQSREYANGDAPRTGGSLPDASASPRNAPQGRAPRPWSPLVQGVLVVVLLAYLGGLGYTYWHADGTRFFRAPGCGVPIAESGPLLSYMQREHIHAAWATIWIGNVVMFKSAGAIVTADPRIITVGDANRIPAYTTTVEHTDRASVLIFALHGDAHPPLLKTLDAEHVAYRVARFEVSDPFDVLVITPLSRTLVPTEGNSLGAWTFGC